MGGTQSLDRSQSGSRLRRIAVAIEATTDHAPNRKSNALVLRSFLKSFVKTSDRKSKPASEARYRHHRFAISNNATHPCVGGSRFTRITDGVIQGVFSQPSLSAFCSPLANACLPEDQCESCPRFGVFYLGFTVAAAGKRTSVSVDFDLVSTNRCPAPLIGQPVVLLTVLVWTRVPVGLGGRNLSGVLANCQNATAR